MNGSLLRARTSSRAIWCLDCLGLLCMVTTTKGNDLTIKMEKKAEENEQKAHYLRREFAYSKYEQTLILPDDVQNDNLSSGVQ